MAPLAAHAAASAASFDVGVQSLEPSIALLPDGTFVFQGWNRPVDGPGIAHVAIGTPGSGAFRDISPAPLQVSHDPYVTVDPTTGRIFSANLAIPGELDPTDFCIVVSSTDDRGATWVASKPVCDPDADRPRLITSRPVTSAPTEGPNLVHLCYFHSNATGQACNRSLDGGRTFAPSGTILPDGCDAGLAGALFGHLATDPRGTLYLARMSCGVPVVAISQDEGVTWRHHAIGPPGWNGYNEMGVAVDGDGVVYGLWVSAERLPWLAWSRDDGATWSTPVMVAPPGITEVNLPEIAAGAGGRIAIGMLVSNDAPRGIKPSVAYVCNLAPCTEPIFYDTVTWHAALIATTDALAPAPTFLGAIVNDPAEPIVRGACGPGRCKANADFVDVLIDPAGAPWLAYVACPGGRCPTTNGRGAWGSSDGRLGTISGLPLN